jgi:hypothetical protein
MKTDDAVSSFLKSIYMTLVHVYGCTVLCTSEKKVMMSYDSIMGRTTDSLIGPQPVTLELKNLDKPQPGTISILEGYTVTDKADGDRAQVFVTDGKSLPHRQSSERHDRRYGMRRLREVLFWGELISTTQNDLPASVRSIRHLRSAGNMVAYLFSQDRETTVSRRRRRLSTCSKRRRSSTR